ncbi:unnamed protein product [Pipistrellus nathusii]|uniref:Uncharacterized protein n=1 Tax=Pipistrellus nathusii TaxID=59473 RepID=A0ABN9ZJ77_PIPNA
MAELVLSQKRCISGRGAFCRPACPGAGGHLWRGDHGHICGPAGVEGHCSFGAGQAGCWLYEVLCGHHKHCQALEHRAEDGRLFRLYQQLEQETGIQTGVQIYDRTSVVHVMTKKGEVTGVETDKGQIECQYFVNCAGQVS